MTKTALYRHYNAAGELLYVGITDCLSARDKQHAAKSDWHGDVRKTATKWFYTRAEARAAEAMAIVTDAPIYNVHCAVRKPDGVNDIGARVLTVRAGACMSQDEFAKLLGVKRSRLSLWECGAQRLSITGALAIHAKFGTSLDWLYFGNAEVTQ